MRRISSFICAVSILVVSSATAAASDISDSLAIYEDGGVARSLKATGTNCASTAEVKCVIKGTNGLKCENNMRVKRSDCKANNNYIPVRVKVRWVHCNKDTVAQTQFGDLVIAKWKGENLDKSDLDLSPIPSGTCRRYQSSETIDYCTRGATLSLKYEGTIDGRDDSYCYAFDYMRVRKEWLPEDKKGDDVQTCSTTTDIRCEIRGGEKDGEDCAGNIVRDKCDAIDVRFQYQYCNWNLAPIDLNFIRPNTWIKLRDTRVTDSPMDRSPLTHEDKCRIVTVKSEINPCEDDTTANMKVRGTVTGRGDQICGSESELTVVSTDKCDYQFVITEVVTNKGSSFIEIYSPNCANKIVTDDFQLVKYVGATGKPTSDITIMKGMEINKAGFIVICSSEDANDTYGPETCSYVTGFRSPADIDFKDSVAIRIMGNDGEYDIHDAFGSTIKGVFGPIQDATLPRGVRRQFATRPKATYKPGQWFIRNDENIDPNIWGTITQSPMGSRDTRAPSALDCQESKSPKMSKSPSDSKSPKESKSPSKSPKDSKSPSESNSLKERISPSESISLKESTSPSESKSPKRSKSPSKSPKESKSPNASEPRRESKSPNTSKAPKDSKSPTFKCPKESKSPSKESKAPKASKSPSKEKESKAPKESKSPSKESNSRSSSPTFTCEDSPYKYQYRANDGTVQARACKLKHCDNVDTNSHCRFTCGTCSTCTDSLASIFRSKGKPDITCAMLIEKDSCDDDDTAKTCSKSCNRCS